MGSNDVLILNAMSDSPETARQLADRIGMDTTKCLAKLRSLEVYGLVERGEDVYIPSCGHSAHTWRRVR